MGPSIHDVDILCQMLEAGMVSGRVDLTWGPLEFHRNSLGLLQARVIIIIIVILGGTFDYCTAVTSCRIQFHE
jgi:hypothetical protein